MANERSVPDLEPDKVRRLMALHQLIKDARREIREITGNADTVMRDQLECLRCGHKWFPNNPYARPKLCARCGSTAWDEPPTPDSRKPTDPPSRSWRTRTGTRRRRARVRLPIAPPKNPFAIPPPAWGSGVIPPPPAPKPFILEPPKPRYFERQDEQQPELVIARTPPTVVDEYVESAGKVIAGELSDVLIAAAEVEMEVMPSDAAPEKGDESNSTREVAGDHAEPALVTSVEFDPVAATMVGDPPPDIRDTATDMGIPATDAEREELEKARAEAWPTTRPED